jgi:hypothetical protein
LREAKLRQAAIVEDVNLHAPRGLDHFSQHRRRRSRSIALANEAEPIPC